MANAFKCDVCGRMHEGLPHEVEGWGAASLMHPNKPRYDSTKARHVVELCGECIKGAEESLKVFAAERRRQVRVVAAELVQIAGNLDQRLS